MARSPAIPREASKAVAQVGLGTKSCLSDVPHIALYQPDEAGSLEARVFALAMSGKLKQAAHRAIAEQLRHGVPITFKRGRKIIRRDPTGVESVIEKIGLPPRYRLPRGVEVIGRK